MVQANRNQQTVKEGVHARTDRAQFLDVLTKTHQTAENDRPDVHQDKGDDNHQEGDRIGTRRRPLKNDSALGSSTWLKRL